MINKTNQRTCIVTRQKHDKSNLIRFVIVENKIVIDKEQKLLGRGYYLLNDKKVIETFFNRKVFNAKKTKIVIPKDLYDQLI